ncbi:hypothetical protein [Chryseobacterium indoltheticum]|jgi:hypothetical protein|uniref:hypothetical protein n=1 Tax=Chryseobacterium indoltheticum TaxID=254 RepID=UPI00242C150B|nr:hypothetical protein [Chryseobacterium indoltheticum]MDF2833747.1 hypothetical protein [Chryseobacterium indoltheticum]
MTEIPDKFDELSSKHFSINFVDASPSELIHNSNEKFISIVSVHFFHLNRSKLKKISQFKKTRGIKRKLQTQKYIIDSVDNNLVNLLGISNWNLREVALKNGMYILKLAKIIDKEKDFNENIVINNVSVNYGLCISLGWYSIVLATFMSQIGQIARVTNKKNAAILLDLLPGDNISNFRNMRIVESIIENSILSDFQTDAIKNNKLELWALVMGKKMVLQKTLKMILSMSLLIGSYNLFIHFFNLKKNSVEYQLSELARYLLKKEKFKIIDAFQIID